MLAVPSPLLPSLLWPVSARCARLAPFVMLPCLVPPVWGGLAFPSPASRRLLLLCSFPPAHFYAPAPGPGQPAAPSWSPPSALRTWSGYCEFGQALCTGFCRPGHLGCLTLPSPLFPSSPHRLPAVGECCAIPWSVGC